MKKLTYSVMLIALLAVLMLFMGTALATTNTGFDTATVIPSNLPNPEYIETIELPADCSQLYWSFTPAVNGEYIFTTTGSGDDYGYLYNASGSQITFIDDDGDGRNFSITYTMTAETTYYLGIKAYNASSAGSYILHVYKKNAFSYTLQDGVLTINGTMPNYDSDSAPWYNDRESITQVVLQNDVNRIGTCAFYGCSNLTSITIPSSVTSIGSSAFSSCSSLTSIKIPSSVTSIGNSAFSSCSSLTSISIPSSVTSIGSYAFYACSSLSSITIPSSVTSIGEGVFFSCSSLTSITIPSSVTSIGSFAFSSCSSLTGIIIPSSVTSIGSQAFQFCSSLNSITIPSSVTSIGRDAFCDCSKLSSFYVDSIQQWLSYDHSSTRLYFWNEGTLYINGTAATDVVIPSDVTSIGSFAFRNCSSLTSISIPSSVTSIGSDAFSGCSSLTSISIPSSVTSIGSSAFRNCSILTSISIPSSVTSIGDYAFYYCRKLSSVIIEDGFSSISDYCFQACHALKCIQIPDSVTNIGVDALPIDSQGLTVYCNEFSFAEGYASEHGFSVVLLDQATYTFKNLPSAINAGSTFSAVQYVFPALTGRTTWFSSNPDVATIDENGIITAVSTGTTDIFLTVSGNTISQSITVITPATALCFAKDEVNVIAKVPTVLTYIFEPSDATVALKWQCSNTSYATVDAYGTVTGKAIGDVQITVKDTKTNLSATCTVHILRPVSAIAFNQSSYTVNKNTTCALIANVTCGTTVLTNECVSFSSADTSIATVNASGIVTGVGTGTTTITATAASGVTAQCTVVVPSGTSPQHTHNIVTDNYVAPTCTETGLTAGSHCSSCSTIFTAQEEIPATGHTEGDSVTVTINASTCTEGGKDRTDVLCSVCKQVISSAEADTDPLGHDEVIDAYIAPTFISYGKTEGSHCGRCNALIVEQSIIPMLTCPEVLTFPTGVTAIGEEAYYGCGAKCIILPVGCQSIGAKSFANCTSLVLVEIPASITSIAADAFEGSSNIVIVTTSGSAAENFAKEHQITYMIRFQ